MNNPFQIWNELQSVYLKYIDTGLPLKEKSLEKERRNLLSEPDAICKQPIIELVPRYPEAYTMKEACSELKLDPLFARFAEKGLFPSRKGIESKMYQHQFESLKSAIAERKHIVTTTGTGSGKTECFLFPLLYDIFEEKLKKKDQEQHALRGIILYPLNALAEDQMRRLRKSLSSAEVTEFLDQHVKGQRITFGRYTGATPFSGRRTDGNKDKLRTEKKNLTKEWETVQKMAIRQKDPEYLFDIPNMDENSKAEYWDRWTIQDSPPDILVTNYSMLNIMLMRQQESDIFDQTRVWLESDPSNIFHLVIDELHSYRGTAGTEVAYLIRLLLLRLGLSPDSPQIQFLCSSASMQRTARTIKFLTGFFGLPESAYDEKFTIIEGDREIKQVKSSFLNAADYISIKNGEIAVSDVKKLMEKDEVIARLQNCISRAMECSQITRLLFGDTPQPLEALEGLLMGLGKLTNERNDAIQPVRAHYFFRNIEGLWACTNPECSEVKDEFKYEGRPIGRLYRSPQALCKCGCPVLELIVCRQCGEIFLGGWEKIEDGDRLLSIEKDIFDEKIKYYTIYPFDEPEDGPWKKCDFDRKLGSLRISKVGKMLTYVPEKDYPHQYPHHCCNCDYKENIKNGLTPIFRHYTGVQKINQLMADSLMYSMRNYSPEGESAKLVLFSDSRSTAAKLSAGIELDHYRDAVRAILLNNLEIRSKEKDVLLKRLDKTPFTAEETSIFKEIRESNVYKEVLDLISDYHIDAEPDTQTKEKIMGLLKAENSVRIDRIESDVINNLFDSGINPGGPAPSVNENWLSSIDLSKKVFTLKHEGIKDKIIYDRIVNAAKKEIMVTLFAHNKRSLEALVQGHIELAISHPDPETNEFLNTAIRILGECWRIEGVYRNAANGFPLKLWKYARKVLNFGGWNFPKDFKENILEFLAQKQVISSKTSILLTGKSLVFIPAKAGNDCWECCICQTVHLHNSRGICSNCNATLSGPEKLTQGRIDNFENYYVYLAHLSGKSQTFRLHCEELTGQTDKQDARRRQQLFQDRIADVDIEYADKILKFEGIDLLSVTTTMEAGVDIGSLSAVMMGNIPPQRFNYQQRVGRAGRRGKAFSVALSIARGNSHDQTHYVQSHRMVSSIPPDPYLDLERREILMRILNKQVLKLAFNTITFSEEEMIDNVHGEFGRSENWESYKEKVAKWIVDNKMGVVSIINHLKKGTTIKETDIEIYHILNTELISSIDSIAQNDRNYTQIALSERLANAGLLPMFGFPTNVRILYQEAPHKIPPEKTIDRELGMAISEFAPGSEVIKDKKVFKPVGVVHYAPGNRNSIAEFDGRGVLAHGLRKCKNPDCKTVYTNMEVGDLCMICGAVLEAVKACSPLGFCVEYDKTPDDFDGRFEWVPRTGLVSLDPDSNLINEQPIENIRIRSNQVPKDGIVHQINDNQGKLFRLGQIRGTQRWVVKDQLVQNHSVVNEEDYALVASRHTGVITLSIAEMPESHYLDGLDPYHRAAFLSWAFLIRKAICTRLDIESNEFDVGFRIAPATTTPEAYIVEKADNGAGYCNYLNGKTDPEIAKEIFIQYLSPGGPVYKEILMSDDHRKRCNSSCYDCLRDYYNQQHHGLLNWRIALDLSSIAAAKNSVRGIDFSEPHWVDFMDGTMLPMLERKLSGSRIYLNGCHGIETAKGVYIITHPFWQEEKIQSLRSSFDMSVKMLNIMDAISKTKY